ncbi:MAG: hypothetical protein HZC37_01985 [Burkholderiales bacterium]|nr:hypothetical protein [Burkholderiales bacterium]
MKSLSLRGTFAAALSVVAAAAAVTAPQHAHAAETCYDFGKQTPGASWPVAPQTDVPIGIGHIRVHPLKLDGVVQAPASASFAVSDTKIAGGASPEMAGNYVAVQMLPREPASRIRLRYSHQPGADDKRAAAVEVNGVRRDWRGSFERLNGEKLGPAAHPARFTVTPEPEASGGNWESGRFVVESRNGIKSFSLGAAHLCLDGVCFMR